MRLKNRLKQNLEHFFLTALLCLCASLAAAEAFDPAQAFNPRLIHQAKQGWVLHFELQKGYHLYAESIQVIPREGSALKMILPPTHGQDLELHKTYYHAPINIALPNFQPNTHAPLELRYQGCSPEGLCFPILRTTLALPSNQATAESPSLSSKSNPSLQLLSFFGLGLLLSLTPCVLPMVPIVSMLVVGSAVRSRLRGFLLSLTYVAGMMLSYMFLGAFVAHAGLGIQAALQQPWVLALSALLLGLLALSMWELIPWRTPSSWSLPQPQREGGRFGGALFLGMFGVLVLSPCVTPPLVTALSYAAQTRDPWHSALALGLMGLGQGVPMLWIGLAEGKLPKTGPWMVAIKNFLGVLIFATAIHLLERISMNAWTLLLWAILVLGYAAHLGAFNMLPHDAAHGARLRKGWSVGLASYGIILVLGFALGSSDPLNPIHLLGTPAEAKTASSATSQSLQASSIQQIEQALGQARSESKPAVLYFHARWCGYCKQFERSVLPDSKVKHSMKAYRLIKVDIGEDDEATQAILNRFNVVAPPTFHFYDTKGNASFQQAGFVNAETFAQLLRKNDPLR